MNTTKKLLTFRFAVTSSLYLSNTSKVESLHKKVIPRFSPISIQNRLFASKPSSFLELFSSQDWSETLDKELKDSNLTLNHETFMYVLKKLTKEPDKISRFFRWAVDEKGFQPSSSLYSLMLKIYAHEDFLEDFWVTIKEMKDKGYFLDEETYLTIFSRFRGLKMENQATALSHFYKRLLDENCMEDSVKEVVEVIKSDEWGERVERKLRDMNFNVSDNFMLRVFKELRKKGYPLKAYNFSKWVERSSSFRHNSVTYNGILRVLCWEETIEEFWSVLEEMKSKGFDLDLDTYVKISRQLQKSKMLSDSVKLYEHMMDSPFKLSLTECNLLLRAIANERTPDLDLVYRVVNKFEAAGNSLSKTIYDGIHRCLTGLGKFDEAEKIIEEMKNAGYEPDNITYSQLIYGLSKARMFDEAYKVLDLMEEQSCAPDIKTWTILIKAHCESNELDKALLCFGKMMEKGSDPDADLLDVLIYGFLSRGRTTGAYKLLVELEQKVKLMPWQSTFKNMIQKLLGERKLEEALELLRLMKKHNYPPFSEPFVKYVSECGTVDDALAFLKLLTKKEFPSVAAYKHVFKSFFDEGRHSEANDLLFKSPHHIRKHPAICSFFGSAT